MKINFLKAERFIKIPARRKLKRHEYRLRCTKLISYFKIPYLRFSLNPFSIAFIILCIFSSDVWPHTKSSFYVSSSPVHLRHHKMSTTTSTFRYNTSKSEPYLKSVKLFNFVNTSSSPSPSSNSSIENRFNTLRNNNVKSGETFLKPPQFLKRFGRSSQPDRISVSRDERSRDASSKSKMSSSIPNCSHVGDSTNDISARAYLADTVFEGKVRSKSTVKDPFGKYGVTFVVQHVYKDQNNGLNVLRPKTQVRLFFVEKSLTSNITRPTAHCIQRYSYSQYSKRHGELTKANIKRGRRYIVFVNRIGPHNYTIIGEPVPQSKKNSAAVKEVLCRNCVKQIAVYGLKNETVNLNGTLKLVCRIRGTPLPALQWFKDGMSILVSSRLRIQYKKRRSLLVIPKVKNSDSGKYECRGLGVQSVSPVSSSSVVTVTAKFDNITALWPLEGKPCPMHAVYCQNGGTCTYYETIGEFMCRCADGYNGGRCENKDVVNSNSTYEPITCFDGVTPSYPCVTVHKP